MPHGSRLAGASGLRLCVVATTLCPVLVGREEELAQLDRLLDAALAGSGGLVLITGEAGIGKSRLGRELGARARARGAATVTGRALPSGTVRPYLPLTEALLQALRDRPVPADPDFAPWRSILGVIVPEAVGERAPDASPNARAEAVVQLLRRISDPHGLVVVLEDVHWADPDTLAVVEYLANNLAGARTLCVATCRDEPAREQITRLLDSRAASRVALARLDEEDTARMARACLPGADGAAIDRVLKVADGVPFLVEEVLASPGVPGSFAETVGARLATVGDEVRGVLSVAAILGRTFDWRLLAAASGQSEQVVDRALELGVREQLLRLEAGVFSFRHALSREAILERMLPSRRRAVAGAALAALDAAHPQPDAGSRDLAADLATESGDTARAGALLAESGRAALDRGALATAIDALRRAHGCGEPTAASPLVRALALAGRVEEAIAIGADTAAHTTQPADRAAVHLELAHAAVAATRWPLARSQLADARRLLIAQPDGDAQARLMVLEAEVALAADDLERARRLAAAVASGADRSAEIRCQAWEILGRIERFTDRDAARERFEQALTAAQAAALPFWQLRAMHELGTIDMFDHAGVDRLLQARRTAEQLGALSTAAVLDLQLVAAYHCRFELAAASRHGRSALAL
ncbi:MAG TPA: AAA family ATPase, partial [Solirubrobacteraceae bacterium]|nr:AAA family ATPase [Solirubrobacteraceae bacterium]